MVIYLNNRKKLVFNLIKYGSGGRLRCPYFTCELRYRVPVKLFNRVLYYTWVLVGNENFKRNALIYSKQPEVNISNILAIVSSGRRRDVMRRNNLRKFKNLCKKNIR